VHVALPADTKQDVLLAKVRELNATNPCTAFWCNCRCQGLDEISVLDTLDPAKDVDALTPSMPGCCCPAGRIWCRARRPA